MNAPALPFPELRDELIAHRAALWAHYRDARQPFPALAAHAGLIDGIIARVWQAQGLEAEVAVIAVGGYGRGELYPHSDIDLLILLPDEPVAALESRLEDTISAFWDLGLEVGHSVRTIDQCLEEADRDVTVETTLLEQRLIAGPDALHARLLAALERRLDPVAFFEAKLLEQQQRHNKSFGVANNLEPNVKESPGGLRDIQTILWIGHALGLGDNWNALAKRAILTRAESRLIRHAERQLARIRLDLHLIANRREDRLVFDLQQQAAAEWGLVDTPAQRASEQLMQIYYRAARTIIQLNGILLPNFRTRLYSQTPYLSRPVNERFKAVNDMLALRDFDEFEHNPSAILEAFILLARNPELTGLAPRTLRALWHARGRINDRFRRDPANHALFMTLLREPSGVTRALRRMHLYGVLGRYIPAFGRITGQMQHDLFHVYTVDEHILMVVRNLRRFAVPAFNHEYPLQSQIISKFDQPDLLYLAGLFHDIAKGRGGDHSQLGTADAREFCTEHGLDDEQTALVVWLVREHLTMSAVAQKEDIYDPDTVVRFAAFVGTPRRLAALYLLTVADIRGTSPKVWNAWKAKLLEDLYHATLRILRSADDFDVRTLLGERMDEARALLRLAAVPEGVEEKLWRHLDDVYFMRHEPRDIAWHARVLNRITDTREPVVRARLSTSREGIKVLVYLPDQPDLFARICSFFGNTTYSIADAKVYTTTNGYALDTFHVFVPEHCDEAYRDMINFIEFELAATLARQDAICPPRTGRIDRHLKFFPITPQVSIRSDDRNDFHVLSIVAGDRRGLLANIACVLAHYQIAVHSAKIMTLGSRVEDSFLLTGAALKDPRTSLAIEGELLDILQV
ncbi:[protein-PII] uridylyltransferase [Microvirgula aerodenitrificans]|uniref:[protein-PII] uridylyltransferase n=1 Tax=Microvirgula aerodenitrificans TaxID=57480 RepID=UPI00248E6003|nr:[protein-PII] uridylyltransferase [Microvirgula aerodenitrificans]